MSVTEIRERARRGLTGRAEALVTLGALDFPGPACCASAKDLERNVYCVLGLPIDVLEMPSILRRIDAAVATCTRFLISTLNLNFLVNGRSDPEFRASVLDSDLNPADGMTIVWIARLIGVPIRERVSGSDI